MQNSEANQLPEVDSLPDGFVDSTTEQLDPQIQTSEQEKSLGSCKDDVDCLSESKNKHGSDELQSSEVDLAKGLNKALEETDDSRVMPDSEGTSSCTEIKQQIEESCQNLERISVRESATQESHRKGNPSSENVDAQGTKKPVTTEVKRKNPKRTFKSEKEFLEFTLKYQQTLAERDAAIAVREKLESLCRELQRQNKMLMDECKRVATEGQSLRLELSNKFQEAIKDVSTKLEAQKDESIAQLKENEMLRNKLKQFAEQFTLTEQHYAQTLKQKDLELQLAELKIKQHEEKLIQEQSQMKLYAEQVSQLLTTEKNLRLQLTADGEKFQQFQDALVKSNEVFETFKQEIEKMTKSIKELKKENAFLKSKSEKSDITLIGLVEERERLKKQLEKTKNQKEKLESLCRSLQAERKQNSLAGSSSDATPV